MKIEKVNDHQIRCTLTGADLANRELKISELAYGTEKAKNLFRDMMQQASFEFGFEAEDIPLMIEAIPVNADCIVLIITKVEDPEEIDTRFSKFAPSITDEDEDDDDNFEMFSNSTNASDEVLDLFHKIKEKAQGQLSSAMAAASQRKEPSDTGFTAIDPRLLRVSSLDALCAFARIVHTYYDQPNTLYKVPADNSYCLLMTMGSLTPGEFGRICNIASEYGALEKVTTPKQAYLQEHYTEIVAAHAVDSLSKI